MRASVATRALNSAVRCLLFLYAVYLQVIPPVRPANLLTIHWLRFLGPLQKSNGASAQELAVSGEALIKQFIKRFYESALQGELEHHLGYSKGEKTELNKDNHRNGYSSKSVNTESGNIDIDVPRDRSGE